MSDSASLDQLPTEDPGRSNEELTESSEPTAGSAGQELPSGTTAAVHPYQDVSWSSIILRASASISSWILHNFLTSLSISLSLSLSLSLSPQAELVKSRTSLSALTADMWTEEHNIQITNFIHDASQQLLVVFVDPQTGLTLKDTLPTFPVKELAYFIRSQPEQATRDNFLQVMQFGTLLPDNVTCLLRILHDMYAPTLFENTSWPDSILIHSHISLS